MIFKTNFLFLILSKNCCHFIIIIIILSPPPLPPSVLASLNLPAAVEDLSGERVPQSVIDKARQVQEVGGHDRILQLMADLPDLLNRNREILGEVRVPVFSVCLSV